MSFRYNLQLTNIDTGKVYIKQIFWNNVWLPTFNKYCQSIGARMSEESISKTEIREIKKLLQAIDESIWNDVILENKDYDCFNLKAFLYRKGTKEVNISLYGLANNVVENNYIFTSYMVINWLRELQVLKKEKIVEYNLSYIVEPDYVILGDIKDNYKLEISYY